MNLDLDMLKFLCRTNQKKLIFILTKFLKKYYNNVISTSNYIIAEGLNPIALIAHLDTVNEEFYDKVVDMCLYDEKQDIFHVVSGGTLDDRLGVFCILQLILKGYRPSIIFTTEEECGGLGALALINDFSKSPFDINFIIELDRKGYNDSVYYTCNNKQFKKYINSFGFETKQGTFTDCLIIGEAWDIAAVNLSCGYEFEHTIYEYAHLKWTEETIQKVENILSDNINKKFFYQKKQIFGREI